MTLSPAALPEDRARLKAELCAVAIAADKAWIAAYTAVCPKGVFLGDFRYTAPARGEPGSSLRALYDARCAATSAWLEL